MKYRALLTSFLICFQCTSVFAGPPEELTKTAIKKAFVRDHISKKRHPGKTVKCLPKVTLERHPAATYEIPRYIVTINGTAYFAKVRSKRTGISILNLGPEQDELIKRNDPLDVYDTQRRDHPNLPKFARFKKHILFQFEEKDWEILIFEKAVGQHLGDLLWDVALRNFTDQNDKATQMEVFSKIGKSIGHFHFPADDTYYVHGELGLHSIFWDSTGLTLTNYKELCHMTDGLGTEMEFQRIFNIDRNFAHFKGSAWQRASHRYSTEHPIPAPQEKKVPPIKNKTATGVELQDNPDDDCASSSSSTTRQQPSSNTDVSAAPSHDASTDAPAGLAHAPNEESSWSEEISDKTMDAYMEYCNAARERCTAQYKECLNALIDGYNRVRMEKKLPAIKIDLDYLR